jgi:hypothetical protein
MADEGELAEPKISISKDRRGIIDATQPNYAERIPLILL